MDPTPQEENAFQDLVFDVIKTHHRMSWLSQPRVLRLTSTSIENCKPTKGPLKATKAHKYSDVLVVAMKSRTSFYVSFKGDHDYFYVSKKEALKIVWEVKKRVCAVRAAEQLSTEDRQRGPIMALFANGKVRAPDAADGDEVEYGFQIDLLAAMRAKAVDGASAVKDLITCVNTQPNLCLQKVRAAFEDEKASILRQILSRERSLGATLAGKMRDASLPKFDDADVAATCVEITLQKVVYGNSFESIWATICSDKHITAKEMKLRSQLDLMYCKPISFFELPPAVERFVTHFTLPFEHLRSIVRSKTPTEVQDVCVSVARSILLAINVSSMCGGVGSPKASSPSLNHSFTSCGRHSAEETCQVEPLSPLSPQETPSRLNKSFNLSPDAMSALRHSGGGGKPTAAGEEEEAEEDAIPTMSDEGPNNSIRHEEEEMAIPEEEEGDIPCEEPEEAALGEDTHQDPVEGEGLGEGHHIDGDEIRRRMRAVSACSVESMMSCGDTASSPRNPTDAECPAPPPPPNPTASHTTPAKKSAPANLAADDILPILIYIIAVSRVKDLYRYMELVQQLGDVDCSERGYYFTMFASAVEYVLARDMTEGAEASPQMALNASPYGSESPGSPNYHSPMQGASPT